VGGASDARLPWNWRRGAKVVVAARSRDQVEETAGTILDRGGEARVMAADVVSPEGIGRLVDDALGAYGAVDLLVNNAGAVSTGGPFWRSNPDRVCDDLVSLLHGPLRCARAVLPGMVERGRGRVINIVSRADAVAAPTMLAYGVAKTALIRFTETLAVQLSGTGVAAFALEPGLVYTDMVERGRQSPWMGPDFDRWLAAGLDHPPERVAVLAAQLASGQFDALSGVYITVEDDLVRLRERIPDGHPVRLTLRPVD
jgi:NAD(P)-dependent dehydrogenase (short-subunit alcohol dehydrogenase family)